MYKKEESEVKVKVVFLGSAEGKTKEEDRGNSISKAQLSFLQVHFVI